jgi:hypothetical protein
MPGAQLLHVTPSSRIAAKEFIITKYSVVSNMAQVSLSQPIIRDIDLDESYVKVSSWKVGESANGVATRIDEKELVPTRLRVSRDRKVIAVEYPPVAQGRSIGVQLDRTLLSETGDRLNVREFSGNVAVRSMAKFPNFPQTRPLRNELSGVEKRDGFQLLFNGESTDGWIGFRQKEVPKGWQVIEHELRFVPGIGGGDLRTKEMYRDFDLRFEWKLGPGGNSGCMYRSTEEYGASYETGPEYQLLDNERHSDGQSPLTSAGANYALFPTEKEQARLAGQWNVSRIVAKGNHVMHYLNGKKVVEFEINSPKWKEVKAKSKFAGFEAYAQRSEGYIVFQDHGDPLALRNIRLKKL